METCCDELHAPSFEFTTDVHLRLLLRLGRGQAAERAVRAAVKLGDRVLDAGTGTGLLSYFAARAGAAQIVAVDRVQIDLAREIARENNLLDRIEFVEADLSAPIAEIQGRFDVLLAFMYTNDIVRDEERARLIHHLRRRFGNDDCIVVPSEVRYSAQACDWPARDLQTQQLYIRDAAASLESAYGYKFSAVIERTAEEAAYYLACPEYEGEYPWLPGGDAAATRFMRTALRLLSGPQPFATHRYDAGHSFEPYPDVLTVRITAPGILNGIIWTQELVFRDITIWTTETFSPLTTALSVEAGEAIAVHCDANWRRTHALRAERLPAARLVRKEAKALS